MDSALSPNTSAFLNYLYTFSTDDTSKPNSVPNSTPNATSFAPSTIFNNMPIPGRDTPEDTPPSVDENISINSVEKNKDVNLSDSDDSENDSPERELSGNRRVSGSGLNKRKVGKNHRKASVDEEEEEDSDSDEVSGHEDKRVHNNDKSEKPTKGRKGRKSTGEDGTTGKKEPNKAARRKEQNRAAQKAFRERRETKVKDLEQKVAELEAKSYGASVENENLRGILKRLQEENISLKQSAFTFSMPINGSSPNNNSGQNSGGTNTPNFNLPRPQTAKPPTPPLSSVDDSLKSINDITIPQSNDKMVDSPESLNSINSGNGNITDNSQPNLLENNAFNAFMFGSGDSANNLINGNNQHRPNANPVQSQNTSISSDPSLSFGTQSSSSVATNSPSNQSDINALWASLYPQGVEALLGNQPQQQNNLNSANQQVTSTLYGNNVNTTPFTLLNSQPAFMSFANAGDNMFDFGLNQSTIAQQPTQTQPVQQQPIQPIQSVQPIQPIQAPTQSNDFNRFAFRDPTSEAATVTDSMNNWNDITDNSVDDFLASLTGSGNGNIDTDMNNGGIDQDEAFNAQLQQIFGGNSPSQLFNLQQSTSSSTNSTNNNNGGIINPFSPTNYLNMSPSPLQTQSQSPTQLQSQSNNQSPQSSISYNDKSSSGSPHSTTGSASSISSHPTSISVPTTSFSSSCFKPSDANSVLSTFGPPKTAAEIVHVVDTNGNIVKPSDLWMKFGMAHSHVVDHLMIDDLCDQMKSKATCNEASGRMELAVKDAEQMFRYGGDNEHQARIEKMKNRLTSN